VAQQAERRQKPSEPGAIEDPVTRNGVGEEGRELEGHRQEDAGAGFFAGACEGSGVTPEEGKTGETASTPKSAVDAIARWI